MVNTKGIAKHLVLKALYDHSRPQGMGYLQFTPGPMSEDEAKQLLQSAVIHNLYFDYLGGRIIKVTLVNDEAFDESLYDRDNGRGSTRAEAEVEVARLNARIITKNVQYTAREITD